LEALILDYMVWIVIAFVLMFAEIFVGGMFALPAGVGAFLVAGVLYADSRLWFGEFLVFDTWEGVIVMYAVLALVSVGLLRYAFEIRPGRKGKDVNEY
jgi:membrane protein implicated in regulation of membrane protease activity